MKHVLLASALIFSINAAHAAKKASNKKPAKISKEQARELCLTSKGADASKKVMKKCISKAMRTGKV